MRQNYTHFYTALVSEEEYKLTEGTTFLEKLFHKSARDFIVALYQGKKMSSKDIKELREYLDALEEEE